MTTFSYFNFFPLSGNAVVNALNPFSFCVEDELQLQITAAKLHCSKHTFTSAHVKMLQGIAVLTTRNFFVLQVLNYNYQSMHGNNVQRCSDYRLYTIEKDARRHGVQEHIE